MAWSAPMTAVTDQIWFASDFNRFLRDNLKEQAPNKATAAGQYFVQTQGASETTSNSITARTATQHTITTSQTTSSTSYTNLSTTGPTLTVTTGHVAAVFLAARLSNDTANFQTHASVQVSGASSIAAHDNWALRIDGKDTTNQAERCMAFHFAANLTPGANVFTMKYRVGGGTGTFTNRHMCVMPLS